MNGFESSFAAGKPRRAIAAAHQSTEPHALWFAGLVLLTGAALAFLSGTVQAQAYPSRPVHLIIPFVAGASSNDIIGRAMAIKLTPLLGQQVVVDNKPGAAGNLGGEFVVKSAPDGYTVLLGINGPMAISPSVYPNLGYDTTRDLAPVALVAKVPYLLAVNPSVPAKNVKELIALAKSQPGKLNFGTTGSGGTPHLCVELLMSLTGIKMTHIPYKGGAQTMIDLVGGQIDMYCAGFSAMIPQIKANKVRAIGSATIKRSDLLPDLPTFIEQGVADFEVASWIGFNVPAKTPQAVIRRLYDAIAKMMSAPDMKAYLLTQGAEASLMTPDEYGAYLKQEIAKWGKIVKAANIKPE
jgi:tripartite-type tricarboxylate transporter receptor subunit TctC